MAENSAHYELAFEAYMRERGTPCVAVDQAKRALFSNARLKSFDFVVYSKTGPNLLVDVKGRQVRGTTAGEKKSLQNWTTERDITDLVQWQEIFGEGYLALLLFAYWIDPPLLAEPGMCCHQGRWYWLLGVELTEYRQRMRRRSAKWETVSLPMAAFRSLARPIENWL
ncbi:MAG TPA: HYExAFE family protein [Tepidisphaeraceae bacterium]|jgi:hypothetical protein|nr:HYExAFE family protein [Tepidisphaeraceae bacterium]